MCLVSLLDANSLDTWLIIYYISKLQLMTSKKSCKIVIFHSHDKDGNFEATSLEFLSINIEKSSWLL